MGFLRRRLILPAFVAPLAAPWSSILLLPTTTTFLLLPTPSAAAASAARRDGEEARWLVESSKWATLSRIDEEGGGGRPTSLVVSIASAESSNSSSSSSTSGGGGGGGGGRIFLYLMGERAPFEGALTFSEAQVDPAQYSGARCGPDGTLDPQDPRCAKLTIAGSVSPCDEESRRLALDALFASHPQMAHWPKGHGFVPCEMKIREENGLWMLYNFGGGEILGAADYYSSSPVRHSMKGLGGGGGRSLEEEGSSGGASCYDPLSHECECFAEKCGDALCGDAGGIWTTGCPTACECEPSESDVPIGHHGWHGFGHGTGGGHHDHDRGGPLHDHGEHHDHGNHHDHGKHHEHGGHHGHAGHSDHEHHQHHHRNGPLVGGKDAASPTISPRPEFGDDVASHARWIVAKSLWTTVSTISSADLGLPFGNVRSVADGECVLGSSGLPYFYVPTPDPTAVDIVADDRIALSFTEAALAERVGDDKTACGGIDAEDPTCAHLTLIGRAVPLEDEDRVESAKRAFGARHPRARWLARGGAHTGGSYYVLELTEIAFLRNYGGYADLSPESYLDWTPDPDELPGEAPCGGSSTGRLRGGYDVRSRLASASKRIFSFTFVGMVLVALFLGSLVGWSASEVFEGGRRRRRRDGYAAADDVAEIPSSPEGGERS